MGLGPKGLAVVRITAQLSSVPSSPDTLIHQAQGTPAPVQPGCAEGLCRESHLVMGTCGLSLLLELRCHVWDTALERGCCHFYSCVLTREAMHLVSSSAPEDPGYYESRAICWLGLSPA